ncbi:glycosyl hydrolase [Ferribacterium limneticum]|nr:glycosyl hydrolase [Ferribacterium limneticum]
MLQRPAILSARASSRAMLSLARADGRIVAVGERGIVLLSDDSGVSWRQAKVPVSVTLTRVWFVNSKLGWAVGHGGVVLHSEDGGETWISQLDGKKAAALVLEAVRSQGTEGRVNVQKLAAEAERLVADGPDKPFLDVYFPDANHGLIVGAYGLAFATEDGGKHWQPILHQIPNPLGRHLYRIHSTGNDLFIAGEQGVLVKSTNGGKSFTEVTTPYAGTYFGLLDGANGELVVHGLRGNAFWSGDAGHAWQKIETSGLGTLVAGLRLADDSLLLIDETGLVLKSNDGGRHFDRLKKEDQPSLIAGAVQAKDGSVLLAGVRGIKRLSPSIKLVEENK